MVASDGEGRMVSVGELDLSTTVSPRKAEPFDVEDCGGRYLSAGPSETGSMLNADTTPPICSMVTDLRACIRMGERKTGSDEQVGGLRAV